MTRSFGCFVLPSSSWVFDLGGSEFKLLIYLQHYSNEDNHVLLDKERRTSICGYLGIGKIMLSRLLGSLVRGNYMCRISSNSFMVNPYYLYRCPVRDLRRRWIFIWNTVKPIHSFSVV